MPTLFDTYYAEATAMVIGPDEIGFIRCVADYIDQYGLHHGGYFDHQEDGKPPACTVGAAWMVEMGESTDDDTLVTEWFRESIENFSRRAWALVLATASRETICESFKWASSDENLDAITDGIWAAVTTTSDHSSGFRMVRDLREWAEAAAL